MVKIYVGKFIFSTYQYDNNIHNFDRLFTDLMLMCGACGVDVMVHVVMAHAMMMYVVVEEVILVRCGDVVEGTCTQG